MKTVLKNIIRKMAKESFFTPAYVLFSLCRDSNISLFEYLFAKKRCYLFMIAMHNNAGDLAQTVCIDEWLENNYPGSAIINVAWTSPDDKILKNICKSVRLQDDVFIHSGFNITDITDEFAAPTVFSSHRIILEELKEHKIVFFPQSVQYKSIEKWQWVKEMYSSHKDIVFISRDYISKKYAMELLPNAKHLAYPDIVTTWIGRYTFDVPQKDVLVCLRFGDESLISEKDKKALEKAIESQGVLVGYSDTDVSASTFRYRGHRKEVVLEKIKEFSEYKVIVTDRYHGTIFSLIAGKPVIVLKTAGHKVESAISWFPDEFNDYVHFIDNPLNTSAIIAELNVLLNKEKKCVPSRYFCDTVYKCLKDDIYS